MKPSLPIAAPSEASPKVRPTLAGVWAGLVFLLLTLLAFGLVLLTPGKLNRSALARRVARIFLKLAGIDLQLEQLERLPAGACVVVANHASYLDGVVMKAALPARFSFVIKKEILHVPVAGLFLRLIGSEFVDRFNRHSGAIDTRRLLRAASQGQSLGFFPEGTIPSQVGIAQFHTGAFVIAVRAGLPVVPVAICGTRAALPLGSIWLKPGKITVSVLPTVDPEGGKSQAAAVILRDTARQAVLSAVREPDLAADAERAVTQPRRATS